MHALPEVLIQLRIDDLHREAAQARLALSVRQPRARRQRTGSWSPLTLPRLSRRPA